MFENELQDLRRFQWRVDTSTRAIFTVDDAREFLHNVGFCLEYPLRAPVLAPTFIGAVIGSDQNLPTAKYAFIHPRAKEATEFKDRLLREKSAFEAGFGDDDNLLISAVEFPYFYALIGDRNPKVPPSAGERGERTLLKRAFELIQEHGPILETALREQLGETVSDVALSRTLSELRQKLRIVRIEDAGGPVWDLLMRWAPQVVNQGKQISAQEALSALVGKYLETCVAAEQKDIEEFFGYLVPRSRVAEVIKALLSAREFSFIQVNAKNLLRNSPRISAEEKAAQIAAAAAPKPEGRANRSFRPRAEGDDVPKKNVWEKYGPKQDRTADREPREERPWKKPEFGARPAAGAGARPERFERRPERFGKKEFAGKKEWTKAGPKRPWQKPVGAGGGAVGGAGGEGAPGERSFRPSGDRPPKPFGAKREWKKPEGRTVGFAPAQRDWKNSERPAAGGSRKEWTPRPAGADAEGARPVWKKSGPKEFGDKKFGDKKFGLKRFGDKKLGDKTFGAKKFGTKPFGARPFSAKPFGATKPWERSGEAGATAPAVDRAETGGAPAPAENTFKKSGFKKPGIKKTAFKKAGFKKTGFKKTGGSFAKSGAKSGSPFKKAGAFKKAGSFKKAGQAGAGFKKPFKKPFKKAFKNPAKKTARPGPMGAKPHSRRPA